MDSTEEQRAREIAADLAEARDDGDDEEEKDDYEDDALDDGVAAGGQCGVAAVSQRRETC